MHYFFLPMVPLTIAGAIFFKKRFEAYGFAVVITLIKMLMTRVSPVYFFMGWGLCTLVYIARKVNISGRVSLVRVTATAVAGVIIYALASNLGVWLVGCTGERIYASNLAGFLACYKAALPYEGMHFLRAVPLTIVLVHALEWMKQRSVFLESSTLDVK